MFGQPQQQQPASTFSFGAPKPSLFGTPQPQQQPAAPTSLFGAPPQQQQQQAAPSPFGQPQQQQPSLFGAPQQQQQQTPAPAAGGMFGGGGMFGQPKPATPTPQAAAGGMFGGGGGMFGAQQQQPQQQQQQFQPAQSQAQPQPQGAGGGIGPKTKFTELPEAAQKIVEGIDSFITQQITLSHSLAQHPLSSAASSSSSFASSSSPTIPQTSSLLKRLTTEATALSNHLASSARNVEELKNRVARDGEDAVRGARIMDASKTAQGRQTLRGQSKFPNEYFTTLTDEMTVRVQTYERAMDQLSQTLLSHLPSHASSHSSFHHPNQPSPQTISQTLQTHQLLLQRLAAQVAFLDEEVGSLKGEWRSLWRERGGGVGDVFRVEGGGSGREELVMGSMRV
ncbi:hypothetical protein BDY24DRAFT_113101 [Mrakia frigida]|uniref:uncharacterized protein n=1 Tax=Mrakia frigida TaxID=29902 RepID=UPI003FCBFB67